MKKSCAKNHIRVEWEDWPKGLFDCPVCVRNEILVISDKTINTMKTLLQKEESNDKVFNRS